MHGSNAPFHRRFASAAATKRRGVRGLAALVLLSLAAGALPATAQTEPRTHGRATIDTNNDGVLDAAELRARREQTFERADADGDGYLTPGESEAAFMASDVVRSSRGLGIMLPRRFRNAKTAEQRFERLDADGDGRISEQEFVDAPHPLLRYDTDGDGAVTREETEQGRRGWRSGLL